MSDAGISLLRFLEEEATAADKRFRYLVFQLFQTEQCCGTVPFCSGSQFVFHGSGSSSGSSSYQNLFQVIFTIKTPAGYLDLCFFSRFINKALSGLKLFENFYLVPVKLFESVLINPNPGH